VNLTDQQVDLLGVLVSNHESNGGAEFYFTLSTAGGGISYAGGISVPGVFSDTDLHQLQTESLLTLIPVSQNVHRGKPTQLGIITAHRLLTQRLFRGLKVTPDTAGSKPVGVKLVDFRKGLPQDRTDQRPFGENPFPVDHPAHELFEEATWKAKAKIAPFKLEFQGATWNTPREFLEVLLAYRKRWFTTCAFEATLIVGNEETADWYEQWIDDQADFLFADTAGVLNKKDPSAGATAPPFFSPEDVDHVQRHLTYELLKMVTHYKGVAASRVTKIFGLRQAQQADAGTKEEPLPTRPGSAARGDPVDGGASGSGDAGAFTSKAQDAASAQAANLDEETQQRGSTTEDAPVFAVRGDKADQVALERSALLRAFKEKGLRQRIRITDVLVAKAANPGKWNDRTMVTWWKRDDSRCKPPHDKKIRAVLDRDPSTIWSPKGEAKSKRR
jgi:hypothetical protein